MTTQARERKPRSTYQPFSDSANPLYHLGNPADHEEDVCDCNRCEKARRIIANKGVTILRRDRYVYARVESDTGGVYFPVLQPSGKATCSCLNGSIQYYCTCAHGQALRWVDRAIEREQQAERERKRRPISVVEANKRAVLDSRGNMLEDTPVEFDGDLLWI